MVAVVSKEELHRKCDEMLAILRDAFRTQAISADIYHKAIVCIAYEYFVVDEISTGIETLTFVPVEYYRSVQPQQLRDDSSYAQIAQLIAKKLVLHGVVKEEFAPLQFVQKPAKA